MNFDPRRETFVAAGAPSADTRAALVCDIAEQLYGACWRYSVSAEFAVDLDEVDDWIAGRAEVPDFLIAGLLRQVRARAGAYAAVVQALGEDTVWAPDGDYSFPGALARNARVMVRECDPESLLYDEATGEYFVAEGAGVPAATPPARAMNDGYGAPSTSRNVDLLAACQRIAQGDDNAWTDLASSQTPRPPLYLVHGGEPSTEFAPNSYREPRVDARDRI